MRLFCYHCITPLYLVEDRRLELLLEEPKSSVLPLHQSSKLPPLNFPTKRRLKLTINYFNQKNNTQKITEFTLSFNFLLQIYSFYFNLPNILIRNFKKFIIFLSRRVINIVRAYNLVIILHLDTLSFKSFPPFFFILIKGL